MFPFRVLNNFSNFLLISIPNLVDQYYKSNPRDSHHLEFRACISRFGIGMEVIYTRCYIEGHLCLSAFDYESNNKLVSQRLLEKLQLPTTFHPNRERIKLGTRQCVKEVLFDIAPMESCHLLSGWRWLCYRTLYIEERSLYLRHEGRKMKFKFMKPR